MRSMTRSTAETVLERAWGQVRANRGAAGIDRITLTDVEQYGVELLRALLRVGVMEEGAVRRGISGTPQGGVVSPLLCNVYLNRVDRVWQTRGAGVLCRYADDLVVMCRSKGEAERALTALRAILSE